MTHTSEYHSYPIEVLSEQCPRAMIESDPIINRLNDGYRRAFDSNKRPHYWSERSQRFATADVLLRYLRDGWQLGKTVDVESFPCMGFREIEVFYFFLWFEGSRLRLPVIANPVTRRLIEENHLLLHRLA